MTVQGGGSRNKGVIGKHMNSTPPTKGTIVEFGKTNQGLPEKCPSYWLPCVHVHAKIHHLHFRHVRRVKVYKNYTVHRIAITSISLIGGSLTHRRAYVPPFIIRPLRCSFFRLVQFVVERFQTDPQFFRRFRFVAAMPLHCRLDGFHFQIPERRCGIKRH